MTILPTRATFRGSEGNILVGETSGSGERVVLLLHGGGQTRHAWEETASRLAGAGLTAIAVDQRGHGESEWVASGHYAFADFAGDAAALAGEIARRCGRRPSAVGASLGGIAALLAAGEAADDLFEALVLVDITPRTDPSGVDRILSFMRAHSERGFGSIEEAAGAVAAYLPNRPRPRSSNGLRRNLRLAPDGRYRWHWDPKLVSGVRSVAGESERMAVRLEAAASRLRIPMLLVRGGESDLVGDAHARDFLALAPTARRVDVGGAAHMVAGDRNDRFTEAVLAFLLELRESGEGVTGGHHSGHRRAGRDVAAMI